MKRFSKTFTFALGMLLFISSTAFSQKADPDSLIGCILKIEVDAGFPGGNESWNKYLLRKINNGVAKQNGAPVGVYTVEVRFLITKEGNIDNVKAVSNYGYGMEEEAVRVIRQAPKWSPAIKNSKYVTQWKQHSITFTVSNYTQEK